MWVSGIIKPFYKNKDDKCNPKNYRPITIVSCIRKLFTAFLNVKLSEFSDEIILINESHCGFRSGYSTTDCMFVLQSFLKF